MWGCLSRVRAPAGCHDMAGNVWEWVNDWYQEDYYREPCFPAQSQRAPTQGEFRVLRGGSWIHEKGSCRCARRYFRKPDHADNYIGFRCAGDGPMIFYMKLRPLVCDNWSFDFRCARQLCHVGYTEMPQQSPPAADRSSPLDPKGDQPFCPAGC